MASSRTGPCSSGGLSSRARTKHPSRPLRPRSEHELRHSDRQTDQLGRPGDGDHPGGEDRTQIAATVKDLGLNGDYLAASKSVKGFDPNRYGAQNPKSLEGFLFPATYELDPGADVDQLVSEQLQAFRENIAGVNMSYAKSKNLTI
jgi:cell division protein YceG involved in septum cleavage